MNTYLQIARKILDSGIPKQNRTGVVTLAVPGIMFEHDMADGFPLLTTKSVPFRLVASELEFFIKGITDKEWLKKNDNHIWDEWCSPDKVPYGRDEATRGKMAAERDLGPIYGFQWRHFGSQYRGYDEAPSGAGVDQLKELVDKLKKDPSDRRLIVSAWNPVDLPRMALPPCHFCFQVTVIGDRLNLLWNQRSVDVAIGLPFNIASYGLLLHLLAREAGLKEGKLVGFLSDTHIYQTHIDGLKQQLTREPFPLPKASTGSFAGLFGWKWQDTVVENYRHHPRIPFEVAV